MRVGRATIPQIRLRFVSATVTMAAGLALAAGAFTLSAAVERWLGAGLGCVALVMVLIAFAVPGRGTAQRLLDPLLALTCVWTIACSRVIESTGAGSSAHSIRWWGCASGAAIGGLGLLGLLLHEWSLERDLRRASKHEAITQSLPSLGWESNGNHATESRRTADEPARASR